MDLSAWLQNLGLERYADAFAANDVDAEILAQLTAEDLIAIGVASVGHRRKLLEAIAALQTSDRAEAAALPTPPRDAERRQLTVLLCDLVGSTALSGELDPEDMSALIRIYQDAVAGETLRFEGHVAKFMGDGVLAYFGWPQAHEDDAERAVRAGLALVQRVGGLVAAGRPLAARIGIATGLVVVGELIGKGEAQERAVVGETPNLAARLQALAEPGSVVISQATRRLVGGLFELTDLGPIQVKGFAEPLAPFRVEGESRAEGRFEALHGQRLSPLVGRKHELAMLLERFAWARDGEGQVVLIAGEAGIGKSRLVRALRQGLAGEPHVALSHFCSPYHTNSALHPIIAQLERAAGFAVTDKVTDKLAKLEALLGQATERLDEAVPLIGGLLGVPSDAKYPAPNLSPQRQRQRTLQLLIEQLAGLARGRPVLELYEDLHWIDPSTLELLDLLVERVRSLPVLAVLTHRPEFSPPWTGQSHVTSLTMNRLGRRQGAALVDRITGGKALPATVLEQILAKTDGVPLFVEELTKTVLESGLVSEADDRYDLSGPLPPLAIPTTLQDSLMARLDRLAPVKEVAQTAAVIGRDFSHELLAAVSRLSETELVAALDQLGQAELIFRRGTSPSATYAFKHALVQDAAYQSLLRPKRQELHLRIVRALTERFPEAVETMPEIVAHHYTAAGLSDEAIPHWQRAGQRAVDRSAHVEAIRQFSKGVELLGTLPATAERILQELDLQTRLGSALMTIEGYAALETQQAYARARALCQQLGEVPQVFPVLRGLWIHHTVRAEFKIAQGLGEECLRLAQSSRDPTLLPEAHFALGGTQLWLGELTSALANVEQGFAFYDPQQHRSLVSLYGQDPGMGCLCYGAWALWLLGYPDQALKRVHQALHIANEVSHPYSLVVALSFVARLHQLRRESRAVRDQAAAAVALASEQGYAYWVAQGMILQGWALATRELAEEGIGHMRQGLADLLTTGAELLRPYFLALFGDVYRQIERTAEGLQSLAEALAFVDKNGERWWQAELYRLKGELLLRRGEREETVRQTVEYYQEALNISRRQQARSLELRAATSLARLWADQGERQKAHELLAPVYDWFTEGFDTVDLKEAKALLDEVR